MDTAEFQRINLAVCLAGACAWLGLTVYYAVKAALAKRTALSQGKSVGRAGGKFIASLILCACVVALPFAVWFKQFYVTGIIEACGVLGTVIAWRERLESMVKNS